MTRPSSRWPISFARKAIASSTATSAGSIGPIGKYCARLLVVAPRLSAGIATYSRAVAIALSHLIVVVIAIAQSVRAALATSGSWLGRVNFCSSPMSTLSLLCPFWRRFDIDALAIALSLAAMVPYSTTMPVRGEKDPADLTIFVACSSVVRVATSGYPSSTNAPMRGRAARRSNRCTGSIREFRAVRNG
jgi:hypothetical protein